jgi:hypothetical protein
MWGFVVAPLFINISLLIENFLIWVITPTFHISHPTPGLSRDTSTTKKVPQIPLVQDNEYHIFTYILDPILLSFSRIGYNIHNVINIQWALVCYFVKSLAPCLNIHFMWNYHPQQKVNNHWWTLLATIAVWHFGKPCDIRVVCLVHQKTKLSLETVFPT